MARPPVLTPRSDDVPRWCQDVLAKAELAENGPGRGTRCLVLPDGGVPDRDDDPEAIAVVARGC